MQNIEINRKNKKENMNDPYEALRRKLNKFFLKVPKTKKFLHLLEMIYTPEQAELFSHFPIPYVPERDLPGLAKKLNKSFDDVENICIECSNRGTLFYSQDRNGKTLYSLPPFIPGLYEFYTMDKNDPPERKKEVLKVLEEYFFETFVPENYDSSTYPFFRVLPNNDPIEKIIEINKQIPTEETKILPFEVAKSYIRTATDIAVAECACRIHAKQQDGKPRCEKPLEVCLVFNRMARYWADRGVGRLISHEEADEVLRIAAKAGLVHCTTNNQSMDGDAIGMICNCCSCCCFILQGLIKFRGKLGLAKSNFQPKIDQDKCKMCLNCVKMCPTEALYRHYPHSYDLSDDYITIKDNECLGCGVCATTCSHDAIIMEKIADVIPERNISNCCFSYELNKVH
ncbi:MAG TPA: 4Fe-4S binding protein [Candidatus Lokiarchaeia archaeon]